MSQAEVTIASGADGNHVAKGRFLLLDPLDGEFLMAHMWQMS